MWGAAQRETSQWDRVADQHGFLVVYPSGAGRIRHRAWHAGDGAGPMKDVRFISALFLPWDQCPDHRPVPLIAFHGTADPATRYHGGESWVARNHVFPDIPTWMATYARRNRCGPNPVESVVAADVTRIEYTSCAEDAAVILYRVEGGGHTWPGGGVLPEWFAGTTSHSIDASSEMWAFFREHPLRQERIASTSRR